MAYAFITKSGSAYQVDNGRITRYGDADIIDAGGNGRNAANDPGITQELVRFPHGAPVAGRSAYFEVRDTDGRWLPVRTSHVTLVAPVVAVTVVEVDDVWADVYEDHA